MTFSDVLNIMDGLVSSCCGNEEVMVFTLNNKEHIDSSILKLGRINVHIHFPLCDFNFFKSLANNYLGFKDHKLFPQVEEVFQGWNDAERGGDRRNHDRQQELVEQGVEVGDRRNIFIFFLNRCSQPLIL
ncbi:unnamed protein product [Camellia sinensis]